LVGRKVVGSALNKSEGMDVRYVEPINENLWSRNTGARISSTRKKTVGEGIKNDL
jgi:hypothetical protein